MKNLADLVDNLIKPTDIGVRLKRVHFKKILGCSILSSQLMDQVEEYMDTRGYFVNEILEKENDFIIIIDINRLKQSTNHLKSEELSKYFKTIPLGELDKKFKLQCSFCGDEIESIPGPPPIPPHACKKEECMSKRRNKRKRIWG